MARQQRNTREAPELEPLDVDGVRTVAIMTVLWGVAFVVLAIRRAALEVDGNGWWLWTCLAGVGLGLLGLEYTRKRRDAIARARLLAEAEVDDEIEDVADDAREVPADPAPHQYGENYPRDDTGTNTVAAPGPAPYETQHGQARPPEDTRPPEDMRQPQDVPSPQARSASTGQQPVVAPGSALPRRRPQVEPDSMTRPIESTAPRSDRPQPTSGAQTPPPRSSAQPSADGGDDNGDLGVGDDNGDLGVGDDSYRPRRARSADLDDDDQPLIETTLGGTRRPVQREDVNEEDDDITEGGTVYRGRRARRRRRDSA